MEVVKRAQSDSKQKSDFLHIGRLQQKEATTAGNAKVKFKHHDQHQNQHHDLNLQSKFWLLIAFGVLFKVSLKVKLISFLKFKI